MAFGLTRKVRVVVREDLAVPAVTRELPSECTVGHYQTKVQELAMT